MNQPAARILAVDDEEDIRRSLKMVLEYEGYAVRAVGSGPEALAACATEMPDLILLDVKMPGMDGIEVLEALLKQGNSAPVVMISGHGTVDTACQALRAGAYDFVEKPLPTDKILASVKNAIESRRLSEENRELKLHFEERYRLVGASAAMREVEESVRKAAPTNATVLITGESGTGKELIARAIHRNSKRARAPFVQVNCAAIPEELIESELFGHEKGSFTGATDRQLGKFVQADRGTMLLDEIGDMSLKTQAKVLRVLQEGEVEPVGAGRTLRVDVRVIAATNKDLRKAIEAGQFREDLFFRLNVVPIRAAPLRERREDIPVLVEHFLRVLAAENGVRAKALAAEALEKLVRYDWKGNVRELRNVLERALIMAERPEIGVADLPEEVRSDERSLVPGFDACRTLRDFKESAERAFLVHKLRECGWNISLTAQKIDTPRSNLYKKIESYHIDEKADG
jgi:two-component system nitrogen regulation response regulator NtrX